MVRVAEPLAAVASGFFGRGLQCLVRWASPVLLLLGPVAAERSCGPPGRQGGWFQPGVALAQPRQRTPRARRRLAGQLRQQAARLMADNRPEQAIRLLEKSLALHPTAAARYLLGECLEALGKRDQAAAEYSKIEPKVATALAARLLGQGVDRMAAGQHAAAARLLERSLLLQPSAKALFLLGQCREVTGELGAARAAYERVLKHFPAQVDKAVVMERLRALAERASGREGKGGRSPLAATRPASSPVAESAGGPSVASSADPRDAELFGSDSETHGDTPAEEKVQRTGALSLGQDRLQIGGLVYVRGGCSFTNGDRIQDQRISMPNLLEVYLDGRPSDRVRAFARGRLLWNPAVDGDDPYWKALNAEKLAVQLDELWLKLDVARRLFVTVGQQKVLWGTARFWNPADLVSLSPRPLLTPFDDRTGLPLLKLHLPVESRGWNFYLVGMMDRVDTFDRAGVAGRAELVFSTVELSASAAYRYRLPPRVGFDISAGIWSFDVVGEVGLKIDDEPGRRVSPQAVGGLQYTTLVFDDDKLIIGGEYFFNSEGAERVSPFALLRGEVPFFYAGRHYAALFVWLPRPGRLNDWDFSATGIGNLSDQTFLARLDVSVKVLTFLTVQMYFTGHLGRKGELRIGDRAFPPDEVAAARALFSPEAPERPVPTQLVDLGLWLRLDL